MSRAITRVDYSRKPVAAQPPQDKVHSSSVLLQAAGAPKAARLPDGSRATAAALLAAAGRGGANGNARSHPSEQQQQQQRQQQRAEQSQPQTEDQRQRALRSEALAAQAAYHKAALRQHLLALGMRQKASCCLTIPHLICRLLHCP